MRILIKFFIILIIVTIALSLGYGFFIFEKVKELKNPKTSITITVYDWKKNPHNFIVGPKNPAYTQWNSMTAHLT